MFIYLKKDYTNNRDLEPHVLCLNTSLIETIYFQRTAGLDEIEALVRMSGGERWIRFFHKEAYELIGELRRIDPTLIGMLRKVNDLPSEYTC